MIPSDDYIIESEGNRRVLHFSGSLYSLNRGVEFITEQTGNTALKGGEFREGLQAEFQLLI